MEALFLRILNMSISAVWLIFAVIILRIFLKKAPKAIMVVLWGIAALRLVVPFSIESVLSLIPSGETVPSDITVMVEPSIHSGVEIIDSTVNPIIFDTMAPTAVSPSLTPMQIAVNVGLWVWLAGMLALVLYSFTSYMLLYNRVKASINISNNVYLCDDISTPFILGIFKPRIYVPSMLNEEQFLHVIAHENAHLKRLDHLWKPFGFFVLTIHWFNPMVWVGYVLLCRDIEFACDEKVVGQMDEEEIRKYSETLLTCSVSRKMITACPVAFGEVGVKQRIKSVLNYRKPMFWVVVAAVIICLITAVFFLTNPPADNNLNEDIKGSSGLENGRVWFEAVVLEYNGGSLLVKPCEGTNELRSSDKIYVSTKTENGGELPEFQKGDKLKITYDGTIMESYPAQISKVFSIEKVNVDSSETDKDPTPVSGKVVYEWKTWGRGSNSSGDKSPLEKYAVSLTGQKFYKYESYADFSSVCRLYGKGYGLLNGWYDYYTKEFFETKILLIIDIDSPSGSFSYEVKGMSIEDGDRVVVDFVSNKPEVYTDDMAYYIIAIEVEKDSVDGCTEYVLKETVTDENKMQPNLAAITPPSDVAAIQYRSNCSTQVTGILGKNDDIFTKADNKTKLDGSDGIHLPIHIIKDKNEFNGLMDQYRGVATAELPDGVNKSLSMSFNNSDLWSDMYVVIVYIDPTMAARGEYNLTAPKIENGKMTLSVVCDNWHEGDIDLNKQNLGWIAAMRVSQQELKGVTEYDAIAYETAADYVNAQE